MARSPRVFNNSPADQREDKANAAKYGVSVAEWQRSYGDMCADQAGQRALDIKNQTQKAKG